MDFQRLRFIYVSIILLIVSGVTIVMYSKFNIRPGALEDLGGCAHRRDVACVEKLLYFKRSVYMRSKPAHLTDILAILTEISVKRDGSLLMLTLLLKYKSFSTLARSRL